MLQRTHKAALLLGLCVLLLSSTQSQAHRLKTITTTVQWNPRSALLEVVHRTYAHDVEHTLGAALQKDGGLENIEAQARTSLELVNGFTLWDDTRSGQPITLNLVGAELEGEFFYIYQEADIARIPAQLRVRHEMLRNYWPDMSNLVNFHYPAGIVSLLFADDEGVLSVSAPE